MHGKILFVDVVVVVVVVVVPRRHHRSRFPLYFLSGRSRTHARTTTHTCAPALCTLPKKKSWIGIMLIKQPFFILGIEDVEKAKSSAFGAAGTFFFCFIVSILYMIRESRQQANLSLGVAMRRVNFLDAQEYGQIPVRDDDDTIEITNVFERPTLGPALTRRRGLT